MPSLYLFKCVKPSAWCPPPTQHQLTLVDNAAGSSPISMDFFGDISITKLEIQATILTRREDGPRFP